MHRRISLVLCGGLAALLLAGGCRTAAKSASSGGWDELMSPAAPPVAAMPAERAADGTPLPSTAVPAPADRQITYNATLGLLVQDIASALDALRAVTAEVKGYMQSMTGNSIVLRIPAGRLDETLKRAAGLGEVTRREITGLDVTEEMRDLDIRLKNLQAMHERLVKVLDRCEKVEDVLKTEKELERVTEELELLKGRIQYLTHAVAYSTLTVTLNSEAPQEELKEAVPFPWVRNLASDVVLRPNAAFAPQKHRRSWLKMNLPAFFVKVYEAEGRTRALSGEGVMLLVQREPNFDKGTLAFWSGIVRRWLTRGAAIALDETREIDLASGAKGLQFTGRKTIGRTTYGYTLLVAVDRKYIYTSECWGPAEDVAREQAALLDAFRSLNLRR